MVKYFNLISVIYILENKIQCCQINCLTNSHEKGMKYSESTKYSESKNTGIIQE